MPEDIENGGIDSVCPDCAIKYAHGEPLAKLDQARLVELPLNSRLDDVLGKFDERLSGQNRVQFRKGLLAQADRNLLYVDEVNLLPDDVIDVLLDAASQGSYIVRRGPIASTYWSRFLLIGSMNPEEGNLRPQIQDRFGLRVLVRGLTSTTERYEVYKRVNAFKANPWQVTEFYEAETMLVQEEIQAARTLLQTVVIPEESARLGLELITRLKIDSLRAEITLFEAARAHAAADKRQEVSAEDLGAVGHMALRLRRSAFMQEYLHKQEEEEQEMSGIIDTVISPKSMERQT
jgi:magnesium chelatase subunit I